MGVGVWHWSIRRQLPRKQRSAFDMHISNMRAAGLEQRPWRASNVTTTKALGRHACTAACFRCIHHKHARWRAPNLWMLPWRHCAPARTSPLQQLASLMASCLIQSALRHFWMCLGITATPAARWCVTLVLFVSVWSECCSSQWVVVSELCALHMAACLVWLLCVLSVLSVLSACLSLPRWRGRESVGLHALCSVYMRAGTLVI